ncbi:MAG: TolC family protein [Nitrospiraceae bacterium]|nr:TolC family protein [Nitrospiraceae bacterium]
MKRVFFAFLLAIFFALCGGKISHAQDGLELTLGKTVGLALRQNLLLKQEGLNISGARAGIMTAKGEFDPAFRAGALMNYLRTPPASIIFVSMQRKTEVSLGFSGKVPYGTRYELKWVNDRVRTSDTFGLILNPYYSSEVTLTLTQPLLKDRGRSVQETALNMAKNTFDITSFKERQKAESIVMQAVQGYWDLKFRMDDVNVAKLSLRLAESLLNETKEKISAGYLPPVDVYEAEAEVYARREGLFKAEKAVKDEEDTLKNLLDLSDWTADIIPVEGLPAPVLREKRESLGDALQRRWDYKAALSGLKNMELQARFYKNQQLPQLDAYASSGLNGLNSGYDSTLEGLGSGNFYSWEIGMNLTIPIGNRTARGAYLKAEYEKQKAQINLRILEQNIRYELREAERALQTAYDTIEAASSKKVAARKRYEAEKERFSVGLSALNDVLRYEVDYSSSLSDENRARADYALALTKLEQASGRLLDDFLPGN